MYSLCCTQQQPLDLCRRFEDVCMISRLVRMLSILHIHCTIFIARAGYHYSVPFLPAGIVDSTRSHIRRLYQHLLTLEYGPFLTFIGLPFKIIPFPQFELQCKYVARMLSGKVQPPEPEEMETWMHAHYSYAEEAGLADRHLHLQSDAQWEYNDWLAEQCGPDVEKTQPWRIELWKMTRRIKQEHDSNVYRDVWDDPGAAARAQAALAHGFAQNTAEREQAREKSSAVPH